MTSFSFFPGCDAPVARITDSLASKREGYRGTVKVAIVRRLPETKHAVLESLMVKLLVPLALAAVAASLGAAGAAGDHHVVIGAIYNLTGGQQNLDIPSSRGARLAVDLANERGGVLGRQAAMIVVDGETKPEIIAAKTRQLIADRPEIAGLIGLSDTDMVLAAAKVAAERSLVFLTSGATSPLLPEQVPEYLFLACFGDNVQAAAGAEWAYDTLKARTVAVLFREDSTYTQLLHGYFETRFKELGGKVLAVESYRLDASDISAKVAELPSADLIYLAAQPDGVALVVPALRNAGIETPILGGDGLDIGEAWKGIDRASKVYFTTHAYLGADNPAPAVKEFRAGFARANPGKEPDAFTALGYDAARLLMAAIESAGSNEPRAVREALARTKDFAGVTGKISFAAGNRIPLKSVTIMQVDGGGQRFEAEILPKEVPPPR
jgi:branched-chain amino acid transport system substrate-binding protein